jgi:CTP synthase (UTP-ammonia lyase)
MLLQIGILGDFNPDLRNHRATNDSLRHAGEAMRLQVSANWLPTESLADRARTDVLTRQDAILAAPGSPFRSMHGMLAGIEFARRRGVPFLGTCGGFQYALIEYARNVLGLAGANTEENEDRPAHAIITPVSCPVPVRGPGAPRLSGVCRISIRPSTRMARIAGGLSAQEEYFCNFEVNPKYVSDFERAGLVFSAFGENGEVRAAEIPSHPFYLATLFQPQLGSAEGNPHPVIGAFLEAAASCRNEAAPEAGPAVTRVQTRVLE